MKPYLPVSPVGRPREISLRQVINAILYVLKTGCQWRQLPRDFPTWSAIYYYFRTWINQGTWEWLHHTLRARLREKGGRHKHPTAGCLDSQSVKCTAIPGVRGFDAGKLINGRKRHILVDTLGLLITVVVTVASVQDREGARLLLNQLPGSCKKLRKIWVDGGYRAPHSHRRNLDLHRDDSHHVESIGLAIEFPNSFLVLLCQITRTHLAGN